jgi:hypothetical protein
LRSYGYDIVCIYLKIYGGALADLSHSYQFTRGCSVLHFNKLQTDSNDNIARMKSLISLLPEYLQHSSEDNLTSSDKRKIKNNEKMIKNIIGSSMIAMASASNETKADAMARGKTAQKLWFDEIAFLFFNKPIMEAAIPAFNKASENAAKYGNPHSIMITTTPGDLCNAHGSYAYKFMNNAIRFKEEMYDLYKDDYKEMHKIIKKTKDKNGFLFIQFQYYELGYDDDWYVECTRALDPVRARREYLLEWINSNSNSPFDPDDVELITDMARLKEKKAKEVKITKYFNMNVYSEYRGKLPVVISCDVSQGIGRDYSTIVVVNPETMEPMAIFKSNNISSTNFKKVIVRLIQKHYPYSILTVENNSIGRIIIEDLMETPIRRLIYKEKKTRMMDQGVGKFTNKKSQEGWEFGHNVNTISRPIMTSILEALVRYNKTRLAYPELAEEIRFMEFKNGRIMHSSATHDDVTFAYLGALYVIKHGKSMRGRGIYYNIAEDGDESIDFEDMDDKVGKANRYIAKHNAKYYRDHDDDEEGHGVFSDIIEDLLDDEDTTSGEFFRNQRKEYLKALDVIDDIEDMDSDYDSVSFIPSSLRDRILAGSGKPSSINLLDQKDDEEDFFNLNSRRLW